MNLSRFLASIGIISRLGHDTQQAKHLDPWLHSCRGCRSVHPSDPASCVGLLKAMSSGDKQRSMSLYHYLLRNARHTMTAIVTLRGVIEPLGSVADSNPARHRSTAFAVLEMHSLRPSESPRSRFHSFQKPVRQWRFGAVAVEMTCQQQHQVALSALLSLAKQTHATQLGLLQVGRLSCAP